MNVLESSIKNLPEKAIQKLRKRIKQRNASVAIIGLGYVGLPLAIRFSQEGFKTIGFDIDNNKVSLLNDGKSYIKRIDEENISAIVNNGFIATRDFSKISKVDIIIICVPTPLGIHSEPDLSFIHRTLETIKPHFQRNQLLVLESTTYPGTTEEEIVPFIQAIKKPKFSIGGNFFVGYSPEREDSGNTSFTIKDIPKVVSGYTGICLELTKTLYDQVIDQTVPVSSTRVAEMTKIMENVHRAVNIGLVNELKMVADKMDIDIFEVIDAAATKPFGFTPFYPGPGLGGHCIPIDPLYLTWKAKEVGMNTRFIELAGEINTNMPKYVVQKVGEALNTVGKSIKGSRILVLGLAYKKNVDDLRESPSLVIIDILKDMGAEVQYSDPFLPTIPKTRKFNFKLKSVEINKENISSFDLLILTTDHDNFNFDLIKNETKLLVDTRGKFKKTERIFIA